MTTSDILKIGWIVDGEKHVVRAFEYGGFRFVFSDGASLFDGPVDFGTKEIDAMLSEDVEKMTEEDCRKLAEKLIAEYRRLCF